MATEHKVRPGLEFSSQTDVGCVRENNEDSEGYWEAADDSEFEKRGRLAVVADGMGGYEGGQDASRMAVETVIEVYSGSPVAEPQIALLDAFQAAHDRIRRHSGAHEELIGMGTTCTAAVVLGKRLYFAHVGDSRLYLVHGGEMTRLSKDHSYVGRLVENGLISAADAERHPHRNILTAALGAGEELTPDFPETPVTLEDGDLLVLCSDGLWGVVGEAEIKETVLSKTPEAAGKELIKAARNRGGPDNITVQVMRVGLPT
jgi:protein phosphatase